MKHPSGRRSCLEPTMPTAKVSTHFIAQCKYQWNRYQGQRLHLQMNCEIMKSMGQTSLTSLVFCQMHHLGWIGTGKCDGSSDEEWKNVHSIISLSSLYIYKNWWWS